MPGLGLAMETHKLIVNPHIKPVKQAERKFHLDIAPQIEAEVNKLVKANFIREVLYPKWLANIVSGKNKNGQIRDAPEDEESKTFRTTKKIYYYKLMLFRLKNVGSTYQRTMTIIFEDILHDVVEYYVDDLVVKSKNRSTHLTGLEVVFKRLRGHQLKMNPLNCTFRWGMDIVGPITPTLANGHLYILTATDYFSKSAKFISLRRVTDKIVANFVRHHIVHRFGIPDRITSDNSSSFKNDHIRQLTSKFNIDERYSSMYNPMANGQVEAFNKSLSKILKNTVKAG
ncbi:uncharacterized protein LOC105421549 [Amborella trichopoda]|uniref:uncharacterized protein LOC105421549 n=1 Tax=Amborella trichopoda TaxID=13333 RepID=UPI0005D30225|nr:uncharacterized protein LOC105421549 [Amborella trichopoda]|eukprot:XP_011627636.1 uncharacterized protein LOC105421549 [Amborella trichopoda]